MLECGVLFLALLTTQYKKHDHRITLSLVVPSVQTENSVLCTSLDFGTNPFTKVSVLVVCVRICEHVSSCTVSGCSSRWCYDHPIHRIASPF